MKKALFILALAIIFRTQGGAEIIPGQAVSWSDFSHVTGIAVGHDFAYYGTTEGILRYHRYENKWQDPITVSDGLGNGLIHRLAVSFDDEEIAVETDLGVYLYEKGLDEWIFGSAFPIEYYRDSRPVNPLPLLFMPSGYHMSTEGYIEDDYFRKYDFTAWIDDNFNSIYVGTWGAGAIRVDSRNLMAEMIPCGLLQKQTDAIYIEGDSIWLGGNAGDRLPEYADARLGVTLYDRYRQTFTFIEPRFVSGFDSEIIYDIAGDQKNIYFAGRQGLTIRPRNEQYYITLTRRDGLPETETTALAVGNDSVWIGTSRGLALYTPSVDTIVKIGQKSLDGRFITDLAIAGERLIIGTDKGAYYINIANQKIGRLKDPGGNLGGQIRHISINDNDLLISSEWGLTRIDLIKAKANLVPFTDIPGGVYVAASNALYIAAATDNGLMLIERKTGRKRLFDERDGLLSIDISTMIAEGDYLWIGSDQGLTRFKWINPDRVD